MKTRSQLSVEIDFDEASRQWNTNKRKIGNGQYQYICGAVLKNNQKNNQYCQRSHKSGYNRCFMHMNSQCIPDIPV